MVGYLAEVLRIATTWTDLFVDNTNFRGIWEKSEDLVGEYLIGRVLLIAV